MRRLRIIRQPPGVPKPANRCLKKRHAAFEEVATPGTSSIAELAEFLHIPASRTAKAVFFMAQVTDEFGTAREQFVFAVVRGDMEVNETKMTNLLKAKELRPATDEEIRKVGAVPGYASPVGAERGDRDRG